MIQDTHCCDFAPSFPLQHLAFWAAIYQDWGKGRSQRKSAVHCRALAVATADVEEETRKAFRVDDCVARLLVAQREWRRSPDNEMIIASIICTPFGSRKFSCGLFKAYTKGRSTS